MPLLTEKEKKKRFIEILRQSSFFGHGGGSRKKKDYLIDFSGFTLLTEPDGTRRMKNNGTAGNPKSFSGIEIPFDGMTNIINISTFNPPVYQINTNVFSIFIRITPLDFTTFRVILTFDDSIGGDILYIENGSLKLNLNFGAVTYTLDPTLTSSSYAIISDGVNIKTYKDSSLVSSSPNTTNLESLEAIGGDGLLPTDFYYGSISNLLILKDILTTETQVISQFKNPEQFYSSLPLSDIVCWFPFTEKGKFVYDFKTYNISTELFSNYDFSNGLTSWTTTGSVIASGGNAQLQDDPAGSSIEQNCGLLPGDYIFIDIKVGSISGASSVWAGSTMIFQNIPGEGVRLTHRISVASEANIRIERAFTGGGVFVVVSFSVKASTGIYTIVDKEESNPFVPAVEYGLQSSPFLLDDADGRLISATSGFNAQGRQELIFDSNIILTGDYELRFSINTVITGTSPIILSSVGSDSYSFFVDLFRIFLSTGNIDFSITTSTYDGILTDYKITREGTITRIYANTVLKGTDDAGVAASISLNKVFKVGTKDFFKGLCTSLKLSE